MKYAIIVLVLLSGCTQNNQQGRCVGLNDDEDPKLKYEYSAWNIFVGVMFFELIAPPIYVALDQLKCPVGAK